MTRTKVVFACLILSMLQAGCSEEVTQSATPIGLYRLSSVQGVKVPLAEGYAPFGYSVRSGDIVLRNDNSAFGLIRGSAQFPLLYFDKYRISGSKIEFTYMDSVVNSGTIAGDSIVMNVTFFTTGPGGEVALVRPVVFRRSADDPVAIREGTYVLTTVANRPIAQQPLPGYVIDYDTLRFFDGVFYRRMRQERARDASGTEWGGLTYSWPGTYRGSARYLLLGFYRDTTRVVAAPMRDSLIVENDALILRTWATDGTVLEDRYERRP